MRKSMKIAAIAALLSLSMTTAAFAGTWKQNDQGQWWWQEDNHSYPTSTWEWIDSNGDGMAECYYFDENGYLLTDTTTPDGYTVNESGAWIDEGVVRQRASSPSASNKINEEGKNIYLDADKKGSELNGLDVKAKAQMNFTYQGENLPFGVDLSVKYHDLNTANMEFLFSANVNMMDVENSEATVFYTDGCCYIDRGEGYKYKYKVDYSEMTSQLDGLQFANHFASYLDNMQVSTDANGNKVLFYSTDKKDLDSYIKTLYDEMLPYLADYDIQFHDLTGKAVITPEGYFLKEVLTANATITDGEDTVDMNLTINLDYNNPGQPVTIVFPSTNGYEEVVY